MGPEHWLPMTDEQLRALTEAMTVHGHKVLSRTYAGLSYTPSFYQRHRFYSTRSPGFEKEFTQEFFYGNGLKLPDYDRSHLQELYGVNRKEGLELSRGDIEEYANMLLWFICRDASAVGRGVQDWISESWCFRIPMDSVVNMRRLARPPRLVQALPHDRFEVEGHFLESDKLELRRKRMILSLDGTLVQGPSDEGLLYKGARVSTTRGARIRR